jgi:hypothetical protein
LKLFSVNGIRRQPQNGADRGKFAGRQLCRFAFESRVAESVQRGLDKLRLAKFLGLPITFGLTF